ncbi:MAG: thermonuclease [Candidatus Hydrogenedentes bacterium]|nr:thermonuclease [Candidatus Hydrogenedentota bacterium]
MRRRLAAPLALALVCLALVAVAEQEIYITMPDLEHLTRAVCEHVVDGDTAWFKVVENGVEVSHKVRFLGIDTPETVHPDMEAQPGGKEASDYVREALEGETVWLEYDIEKLDKYDRQLCHIWLKDGTMFNLSLVRKGFAVVLVVYPNIRYHKFFLAAQDAAASEKIGVWGDNHGGGN